MVKRELKETYIKVRCSEHQKQTICLKAEIARARSLSDYVLTVLMEGNLHDYGTLRRKADAPLANAQLYKRLGELIEVLNLYPSLDGIEEVVELVHTLRREISLRRLSHRVEEVVDDL